MSYQNKALRNILFAALAAATLIIFAEGIPAQAATSAPVKISTTATLPPTVDELQNASYAGIDTSPIKLTHGSSVGVPYLPGIANPQRIELLDGLLATGDLNGDGASEYVVFLSENNGGTGTFLYMAVMGRSNGKILNIATVRVGDRAAVRSLVIDKGQITLDLLQFGAKDLACCPSELATRVWTLERSGLVERVAKKRMGILKPALLEGVQWLYRGGTQPGEGAGATLTFDKEHISGSGGCNRYQGKASFTKVPGELSIKASKSDNKECGVQAMTDENKYLELLRRVVRFGYYQGDLTLTWQKKDGTPEVMRFTPRKGAAQ